MTDKYAASSIGEVFRELDDLMAKEKQLLASLEENARPLVDRMVAFLKKGQEEAHQNKDGIKGVFFNGFGLYREDMDSIQEGAWSLEGYRSYARGNKYLTWKNLAARHEINIPAEYFTDPDAWESWFLEEISKRR